MLFACMKAQKFILDKEGTKENYMQRGCERAFLSPYSIT